jgi:O-acetylhomoserine/O-acetylserine sulfhydrylase-like pyridoxal-dependent enzyme
MGIAVQQVAESFDTLALHAGAVADPTTGALLTPIYLQHATHTCSAKTIRAAR